MQAEISYDLVMDDDMEFVEGTYRMNEGEWQVFIISKRPEEQIEIRSTEWASGCSGLVILVPMSFRLNKQSVEEVISEWLGLDTWTVVRGPDSMQLR